MTESYLSEATPLKDARLLVLGLLPGFDSCILPAQTTQHKDSLSGRNAGCNFFHLDSAQVVFLLSIVSCRTKRKTVKCPCWRTACEDREDSWWGQRGQLARTERTADEDREDSLPRQRGQLARTERTADEDREDSLPGQRGQLARTDTERPAQAAPARERSAGERKLSVYPFLPPPPATLAAPSDPWTFYSTQRATKNLQYLHVITLHILINHQQIFIRSSCSYTESHSHLIFYIDKNCKFPHNCFADMWFFCAIFSLWRLIKNICLCQPPIKSCVKMSSLIFGDFEFYFLDVNQNWFFFQFSF
jgi:hypothetical protein